MTADDACLSGRRKKDAGLRKRCRKEVEQKDVLVEVVEWREINEGWLVLRKADPPRTLGRDSDHGP